jgi:hypothetical protein
MRGMTHVDLRMSAVLRTEATDEKQGFMKVLVGDDDRIIGFTMIGSEAGEVMAAIQTAMLAKLPYPVPARRGYRPSDDCRGPRAAACQCARSLTVVRNRREAQSIFSSWGHMPLPITLAELDNISTEQ